MYDLNQKYNDMKQTIYKKDTKDRLRFLTIETEGPKLIQTSGLIDTENPVVHEKVCNPKNVGKSNETTPEEQAVSEAESKIKKKLDKGYFETKELAETTELLLRMKAKDYDDHAHKINWDGPVFAQPKLDGQRCNAHKKEDGTVEMLSADGKLITTLKHVEQEVDKLLKPGENIDGELYAHGYTFQENMMMIKKYRPGLSEKVLLHTYDIVSDKPFLDRYSQLQSILSRPEAPSEIIVEVETTPIDSEIDLEDLHSSYLAQGYEGTILRHGKKGYKVNGRCDSVLKYKDFIDIAITLKDVRPGDARPEWGVPIFHWPGAENDELRAGTKLSHEMREEILLNKHNYIGCTAEVRFFEYSDTGVPRHPVLHGFRQDK